jgi:hypothetical protein
VDACRIAGFVSLGLILLVAGLLGAPPAMLAMIGALGAASAFLPRGSGAAALHNLAQKRYDRERWEAHWSEGYLHERPERGHSPAAGRGSSLVLPPGLLPKDPRESGPWLRTLAAIRDLPEGAPAVPSAPARWRPRQGRRGRRSR